jgi:hypothetical protein
MGIFLFALRVLYAIRFPVSNLDVLLTQHFGVRKNELFLFSPFANDSFVTVLFCSASKFFSMAPTLFCSSPISTPTLASKYIILCVDIVAESAASKMSQFSCFPNFRYDFQNVWFPELRLFFLERWKTMIAKRGTATRILHEKRQTFEDFWGGCMGVG